MSTEPIRPIFGTDDADSIHGTQAAEVISARAADDYIYAYNGGDLAYGGTGDDTIYGHGGSDVLYGGGGPAYGDLGNFVITEDYVATITFLNEGAGFRNTLGVYDIDPNTREIINVEILFANASKQGSGGSLVGGESKTYLPVEAGDELGFFIVSNGYGKSPNQPLLDDTDANWIMVDANGNAATEDTLDPKLVHVDSETGAQTTIVSQYGSSLFHSSTTPGEVSPLNVDGLAHAVGRVTELTGTVLLGFEDLKNGGDKDFDDVVFELDIGQVNAATWIGPDDNSEGGDDDNPPGSDFSENDILYGGTGSDQLFGMAGNDKLYGGDGNDLIYGNSGDDELEGGTGSDELRGGTDNDVLRGNSGHDTLIGNSGEDTLYGGTGNDNLRGGTDNDILRGGSGHDTLDGNSGDDILELDSGNDHLKGGGGSDTVDGSGHSRYAKFDLHAKTVKGAGLDTLDGVENVIGTAYNDWIRGDKRDNIIDGGDGNDTIRGQEGDDTLTGGNGADKFIYLLKDINRFQNVDDITDFDMSEDKLDLSRILDDATDETVQDYVEVTVNGDDLALACNYDGDGDDFTDVCVLEGLGAFTLESLMDNDALIL